MKITVNGEAHTTQSRTLADLCLELGFLGAKIATARNGDFVASATRSQVPLAEGDVIEVVSPRQGG